MVPSNFLHPSQASILLNDPRQLNRLLIDPLLRSTDAAMLDVAAHEPKLN